MMGVTHGRVAFVLLTALLLLAAPAAPADAASDVRPAEILVVRVEGTVTAGTTNFLKESIDQAAEQGHHAVVVLIDTPGGLVDSTLEIIKDLLNAPVPVITYVYPRGAIAASAGTFILIAGHIAAMSPGTTVGAAMPVVMQPAGEETRAADEKTINFLAGHMTNIAEERGRPTEEVERFVTENLTIGAVEAEQLGVVDLIADNLPHLLEQLDGREVMVAGRAITLQTADATLIDLEMTVAQRIIHFISNPQVALLLFLLGVYGIFFGLNMPGTFVPETLGAIALILALFGLGMFEVNALGIVLIIMAIVLFVAEAFTPTFGFFTVAGAIALVVGALLMPVEPLLPAAWFRHFRMTVFGMAAVTVGFFVLVITKVVMVRKRPAVHLAGGMEGYLGTVVDELDPVGTVKIRGEWWKAKNAVEDGSITRDSRVRVVRQEGMVLIVKQLEGAPLAPAASDASAAPAESDTSAGSSAERGGKPQGGEQ